MIRNKKRRRQKIISQIFQRLDSATRRRQHQMAEYLNRKTAGFSQRRWIWLLLLFSGLFGAAALKVGLNSMNRPFQGGNFQPGGISIPKLISERRFMDSLAGFEQWRRNHYKHLETIKNGSHDRQIK
ncbi:hypothetical protein [Arachidicoccus terrestris]|uniref:hypothetical protein n=1 Tax=Arachidicoccus terrestris TaxID=2875539 RepID=UPI001CC4C83B|nr:hypothetical protein [Arachidicoccus terrestris]UAY55774.1 hypothetical protein K9M52_01690 [Arachidicoccus terrestris]